MNFILLVRTSSCFVEKMMLQSMLPLPLLFLPAWAAAGAFSSSSSSLLKTTHQLTPITSRGRTSCCGAPYVESVTRMTNSLPPSLLFLRGGQQQTDEDTATVASDETTSTEGSVNMKRQYGSTTPNVDEVELVESQQQPTAAQESTKQTSTNENNPSSSKKFNLLSTSSVAVATPILSTLQSMTKLYTQSLINRPILTKSLTAGIIFGLSDWCAQLIESSNGGESEESGTKKKETQIVVSRIVMTFLVGLLFFGPAANAWYSAIFKFLPSTSLLSTLQKAALGQIFFGPTFTIVFFGAGMIQGGTFTFKDWLIKIRNDLPGVWASGLGYWPLVDFISYKVVPVQWIPLFVNFCSFVWTIYLSLVANRGKEVEE